MAETTGNDDLAAAVRDRGMEQLEGAKGQLAEGAERVAAAVDSTAERLEGDGDNAISGFGHSVASLMRQLAGGLRERDVEDFARELAALARRNPGVFLAGSVALGFGIARFFKARTPQSSQMRGDEGWQSASGGTRDSTRFEREHDAEERLDLSANSTQRRDSSPDSASKSRSTKHKAKPQRSSTAREQQQQPSSAEPSATESTPTTATSDSNDSAFTGGTGGDSLRGGKS
jgi:hypothetical protein